MTNRKGYVAGKLSESHIIGKCYFGHPRCSEWLHFPERIRRDDRMTMLNRAESTRTTVQLEEWA